MTTTRSRIVWILATVALAAGTSYFVTRTASTPPALPAQELHEWMHEQLALSHEQHDALEPIEHAFATERERLKSEIAIAGRELAASVRQGKSGSPEIETALSRLNAAQAALQRATLDHFFAMKDHLDPAQAEKLLQWTHDSLLPR
ncbi:periplasmic heavy metal sensor [Luteolibacter arcticus]|uniref:Periplasmic heavy metal sensor n=1 Tax=Luteolibacter arcticus TaxID=1581411 RepID=A0ABT3GJI9_9BACT|nr:periplasmic heavy metal sensor [Luteolibacter arcticus]MCW1923664.1 periplasmic heavy metal sensor [Luteolibacter arcticus]